MNACFLFNALVCPILEYDCEVWIVTADECLEMVHVNMLWAYQFLKLIWHAMGIGEPSPNSEEKIWAIEYWIQLAINWDLPPLLHNAFIIS